MNLAMNIESLLYEFDLRHRHRFRYTFPMIKLFGCIAAAILVSQTAWASNAGNLTWRELRLGMTEAQVRVAMEQMGFPLSHAKPMSSDGSTFKVMDPYRPHENCMPTETQDCTTISLTILENPACHQKELVSFRVAVWLAKAALVSKLIGPAVAKYGPPDAHTWSQDRDPTMHRGQWHWV